MKFKAVSGIMLTLLLIGMLTLAFNIRPVKSEPTIWTVDDDGPADFSSIQEAINSSLVAGGDTIFVLSGTYYEQVVVNKSVSLIGEDKTATVIIPNLTEIDYAVYISANNVTISGFEIREQNGGILLDHSSNCTVNGNIVKSFDPIFVYGGSGNNIANNKVLGDPCAAHGIDLLNSDNNVVTGNYLGSDCHNGLVLINSNNNYIASNYLSNHLLYSLKMNDSSNNTIVGNTISFTLISMGGHVYLEETSGNALYHNSFITYGESVGPVIIYVLEGSVNNTWDTGYPYGGNYWENYTGVDVNMDGIGDSSYEIDSNNIDHYPLMGGFSDFTVTSEEKKHHVTTVCNSTISAFQFDQVNKIIRFDVTGEEGTGFCRVCIPHDIMKPPYNVTVDGVPPQYANYTLYDNGTHRWIYFIYSHSTHEVMIIQNTTLVGGIWIPANKLALLTSYIGLTITLLLAVAVATVVYVKKRKRHTQTVL